MDFRIQQVADTPASEDTNPSASSDAPACIPRIDIESQEERDRQTRFVQCKARHI